MFQMEYNEFSSDILIINTVVRHLDSISIILLVDYVYMSFLRKRMYTRYFTGIRKPLDWIVDSKSVSGSD